MRDMPDGRPVRIYKIGGSLFGWPELFDRLTALLKAEPGRPLLVSGGGAAADVVRDWDRIHRLGDEQAHRLAIASLRLGEAFLAAGMSNGVVVVNREAADVAWTDGRVPILDATAFLRAEEAAGAAPLPCSWNVTSDSIAAWIAGRWPAELVLVKSTCPAAANFEFVDRHFPVARPHIRRCEWINLRSSDRGDY